MSLWSDLKKEYKQGQRKKAELKSIEQKALHEARKKQAVTYGKKRAAYETTTKMKALKTGSGGAGALLGALAGTNKGKKRKGNTLDDIKKFI
jgi:hypothetical protein